ncbi:hypothetical protein D3C76_1346200 [compost metagenome]
MPVAGLYPGKGVPPIMTLFVSNTAWGGRISVTNRVAAIFPVLLIRMEYERDPPTDACAALALLTILRMG